MPETPTPYETPDGTATASVRSVLAQVHVRTARAAVARGVAEMATTAEDEPLLRTFLRKATRHVAVRTGRVLREGIALWSGTAGVLPGWALGARIASATWTPNVTGAATVAVGVVHGALSGRADLAAGDPRTLVVSADGTLLLLPATGQPGAVRFVAASRAGLDEDDAPEDDAFAADGGGTFGARLVFPTELEEAVVRFVLSMWCEDLDAGLAAAHMARFEDELATFGSDPRREGFAATGYARADETRARLRPRGRA